MSARKRRAGPTPDSEAVGRYKAILQKVMDTRPSGTRQRLAGALGKNRSFVSQITSPAYATPIPARHLETIFEICHFAADERKRFLGAYALAHLWRTAVAYEGPHTRPHTVYLPDLGNEARNHELDRMVGDFIQRLTRLIAQT